MTAGVIRRVRVLHLELPFRVQFTHHLASRGSSSSILLAIETAAGAVGWGETLPREYVTGETLEGTLERLAPVAAALVGTALPDEVSGFAPWLERLAEAPAARCALELALVDLVGKLRGLSATALFGAPRCDRITYSAVLPVAGPAAVGRMLDRAASLGLRQVKLKAAPELADDLINVRAAAERIAGAEVRIDANAAWSLQTAREHLPMLQDAGVVAFEQPLAPAPARAYVELANSLPRPARVTVDESACHEGHVRWFIDHGGASGVNLKVGKHGGLGPSLAVLRLAQAGRLECQLGAHVGESSLLASAGATLAGLAGDLTAHEGCAGLLLLEHDVTEEPLMFGPGGALELADLHRRPGLGVAVEERLVARATRGSRCWG